MELKFTFEDFSKRLSLIEKVYAQVDKLYEMNFDIINSDFMSLIDVMVDDLEYILNDKDGYISCYVYEDCREIEIVSDTYERETYALDSHEALWNLLHDMEKVYERRESN